MSVATSCDSAFYFDKLSTISPSLALYWKSSSKSEAFFW
jgi:hypothetical protein